MHDQVRGQHLLERGAKGGDQFGGQVADEPHRVREDHLGPVGQLHPAHGRIERGKQHVLGHHLGAGQPVEQRRFARVGIAHQRHDRVRHLGAGLPVQLARLHHLVELPAQAHQLVVDGPPVGLDLRLARPAHEAQPAALALQVGPGAHQARALVGQRGHFHLQHALAGGGAVRENLEDQPGAVEDLHPPGLFQVALLHRAQRPVHQHEANLVFLQMRRDLVDLAGAEQVPRLGPGQAHDLGADHVEIGQRRGQRRGLFERRSGGAAVGVGADIGVQHPGTGADPVMFHQEASSPS